VDVMIRAKAGDPFQNGCARNAAVKEKVENA
jgi:hypothetical protein